LALNAHILGAAKLQNAWVSGVDVDDNTVPSYATFSLSGSINFDVGSRSLKLTFGIDNLLDKDPIDVPVIPATVQYSAPGLGGRFDLYDPLGRRFRIGVRTKF